MYNYADRPLVYLAAPYTTPDPVTNTHTAIKVASELIDGGLVTPVVPHLTLVWNLVDPREVEFWYAYDLAILARCDAVLRMPGVSTGADAEVQFAADRGIPVLNSMEELVAWAHQVQTQGGRTGLT